jgi:hypothetical protein
MFQVKEKAVTGTYLGSPHDIGAQCGDIPYPLCRPNPHSAPPAGQLPLSVSLMVFAPIYCRFYGLATL